MPPAAQQQIDLDAEAREDSEDLEDAIVAAMGGDEEAPKEEEAVEETPEAEEEAPKEAASPTEEEEEDLEQATSDAKGTEAASDRPSVSLPSTWPASVKRRAQSGDLEGALQELADLDAGREAHFGRLSEQFAPYKEVDRIVEPYKQALQANGQTPAQWLGSLVAEASILQKDPVAGLSRLMQNLGVTVDDLQNQGPSTVDPVVAELSQRLTAVEQEKQRAVEASRRAVTQRLANAVNSFSSEADASGAPKFPHFEKVKQEMAPLVDAALAANPHADPRQVLEDAYGRAVRLNPETWKLVEAKIREDAIANRVKSERRSAQAAVNAASSISGNSSGAITPEVSDDLESLISDVWDGRLS